MIPHDPDAERALIGYLALNSTPWRVTDVVAVDDFYVPQWARAYELLLQGPVDLKTLAERADIDVKDVPGIAANAAMNSTVDQAIQRVLGKAQRRHALRLATEAATAARDESQPDDAAVRVLADFDAATRLVRAEPSLDADEFVESVDFTNDWLVPQLLERGDRMLITAGEGAGKSTLLRQMAVMLASGLHPFTGRVVNPMRVMLLDCENSPRMTARALADLTPKAGKLWNPGNLLVEVRTEGLDITRQRDLSWLSAKVAANRPDVLVIGPLYRLYAGETARGDVGGEDQARNVTRALDRLRTRHNLALVMETHAPHAQAGGRDLRPFGSSVWLRWPEFGIGLKRDGERSDPDPTDPHQVFQVAHWRNPRDRRQFPKLLRYGRPDEWPWVEEAS